MRKHAGRPGRKKWAKVLKVCRSCGVFRWLDINDQCKQCRRGLAGRARSEESDTNG